MWQIRSCLHFLDVPCAVVSRAHTWKLKNRELHLLQSKGGANIAAGGNARLRLSPKTGYNVGYGRQ